MNCSDELVLPAAPARWISPRRTQRQEVRAQHRREIEAQTRVGFGRAQRRHPDLTPDAPVPDKDKVVWLDIVLDHDLQRTTRFEVKCLDCGSFGHASKRKQAIDLCGVHLQEKHPGVAGRVRRDVV